MMNRKQLTEIITKVDFHKKAANTFFTQKARTNITGHAWLVETEAGNWIETTI